MSRPFADGSAYIDWVNGGHAEPALPKAKEDSTWCCPYLETADAMSSHPYQLGYALVGPEEAGEGD